jgi:hypothetical protein
MLTLCFDEIKSSVFCLDFPFALNNDGPAEIPSATIELSKYYPQAHLARQTTSAPQFNSDHRQVPPLRPYGALGGRDDKVIP